MPAGAAWLAAVSWDLPWELRATVIYGQGDEEFQPVGIHYWRRPLGLFGAMQYGALPAGSTLATGSLSGIEEKAFIIDHGINEQLTLRLIHENVKVNDTNPALDNFLCYHRIGLGLDYRYRPNTNLELAWDTINFNKCMLNRLLNSGGWERYRLGMRVKF